MGHSQAIKTTPRNLYLIKAIELGLKKGELKGYQEHLTILCVMDTGDGAGLVYRNDAKALFIPMPIIGHLDEDHVGLVL